MPVRRSAPPPRRSRARPPGRPWRVYAGLFLVVPLACALAVAGSYYVTFSRLVDERLHGERARVAPRVFARPFELRPGQTLTDRQLIDRLNELGYAHRPALEQAGEFAVGRNAVALMPRTGPLAGRAVRVVFRPPQGARGGRIERIERPGAGVLPNLTLEAPLVTALASTGRQKRRNVGLDLIPARLVQAVLAIEDRRFYEHPGVDPIRAVAALVTNLRGDRPYLVGGSTITQQLVKNLLLTPEKTLRRKVQEQFMALILERRLSKDEILALYLNEVYLGQRGSFAIHGVAEAARMFFGKDVGNVTLSEAATIAGVIQSPGPYSPFRWPDRARDRRNVVLRTMVEAAFIEPDVAERAAREPLTVQARALESEAPYFVDFVGQTLLADPGRTPVAPRAVDVHTTLDLHLQRLAQDAVREGLAGVDERLARRRSPQPAQAALVAVDPRTGEILAMVGGRSYAQSQYNRAAHARRQPGSVFKPFVYLAAFERAVSDGRTDLTPATLVWDEPTQFLFNRQVYTPANYGDEYDGQITLRRALALSRNVPAVKLAEAAGYDRVAALWQRVGAGTPPRPYPSIALGVFETTPLEVAAAYTVFPNLGALQPLQAITRTVESGRESLAPVERRRPVSRGDTAFLVLSMLRSVVTEGTGASARAAGFAREAAGKSGTTNDLRDAWFVGFTPELLTVVWVGFDDNRPLGLTGSQAALPIWTTFMIRALGGHPDRPFNTPAGITFLDIDRDTGHLAMPGCPRVFREAFLDGTEPLALCALHRF